MRARVLIVEDDAALAGVLRDNLAYEGFDVNCAFDGVQALAVIGEHALGGEILGIEAPAPLVVAVAAGPDVELHNSTPLAPRPVP